MGVLQRTAMQVLEDAIVKQRVLNGLQLLKERHGDGWVDKIDLATLDLANEESCVLGQVYRDATVDEEQAERWAGSNRGYEACVDDAAEYLNRTDGYTRGIAILDGPLLETGITEGPAAYGFDSTSFYLLHLREQDDDTLAVMGVTREMVEDAIAEAGGDSFLGAGWAVLEREWRDAIVAIRETQ